MEEAFKRKTKLRTGDVDQSTTELSPLIVKPRRMLAGLVLGLILLAGAPIAYVSFVLPIRQLDGFMYFTFSILFLIAALYFNLLVRSRPLYEVDSRGITDNGLLGGGYGLIEWRNIKSVQKYVEKGQATLMLNVDNMNDLLDGRNPFVRPLLWVNSSLNSFIGGEIALTIACGDVDPALLLDRISQFSRDAGRDVVIPQRGFVEDLMAKLLLSGVLLLLLLAGGAFGAWAYIQWLPHSSPSLEILGAGFDYPSNVCSGKGAWIEDVLVHNFGGTTTGVKVELSGSALDNGALTQPCILLQYDGNDSSPIRKRTREILTLRKDKNNHWVGTSNAAILPRKDNDFVEMVKMVTGAKDSIFAGSLGWWSDMTRPNLTLGLYADAKRGATGELTLRVTPLASARAATTNTMRIINTSNPRLENAPLYSVSVPKTFPVSLYPEGQIIWLAGDEFRFDSVAKPEQIAAFYQKELQGKGWKSSIKDNPVIRETSLHAKKGGKQLEISIEKLDDHTPVKVYLF